MKKKTPKYREEDSEWKLGFDRPEYVSEETLAAGPEEFRPNKDLCRGGDVLKHLKTGEIRGKRKLVTGISSSLAACKRFNDQLVLVMDAERMQERNPGLSEICYTADEFKDKTLLKRILQTEFDDPMRESRVFLNECEWKYRGDSVKLVKEGTHVNHYYYSYDRDELRGNRGRENMEAVRNMYRKLPDDTPLESVGIFYCTLKGCRLEKKFEFPEDFQGVSEHPRRVRRHRRRR